MSSQPISPGVQEFVTEHIHSVTQLELLLLLHRDPEMGWTARDAAAEMRYPEQWAADQLERFAVAGLLASEGGVQARYRYSPSSTRARVVDELAELYRRRRIAVTSLIFTPVKDEVRLLSDAFLIRRDEDED